MGKMVEADTSPVRILVLNFNGKTHLKKCLNSLLKTNCPRFNVVVIDNGLTDGSAELLKSNYPSVKVVKHHQNYGYAVGYNFVIDQIENEYIVLLNNDIIVKPDWLKELIVYIKNEDVAAVAPKMKFFHDETRINAAGENCDLCGVGWSRGNGEVDMGQYDAFQEVFLR